MRMLNKQTSAFYFLLYIQPLPKDGLKYRIQTHTKTTVNTLQNMYVEYVKRNPPPPHIHTFIQTNQEHFFNWKKERGASGRGEKIPARKMGGGGGVGGERSEDERERERERVIYSALPCSLLSMVLTGKSIGYNYMPPNRHYCDSKTRYGFRSPWVERFIQDSLGHGAQTWKMGATVLPLLWF